MADVLSQAEIDALLNDLSSGKAEPVEDRAKSKREAKPYDFSRPSKFNKDQLRTLEIMFDNYARLLSSFLTGYLRTASTVEVISADQVAFSEFTNLLTNPVVLAIVELHPLKGSVILQMTSNLGYSVIERILGGAGFSLKKVRDFSDLEKILLERVINQCLTFLPETWENVLQIHPNIDKLETNSQFAQITSPNEMCALVSLNVKIGGVDGFLNFCIPHLTLEPVMNKLYTKYWYTTQKNEKDQTNSELIESKLNHAKIPVTVMIGKISITVSDFINLQAGDVLYLDSPAASDLNVMIGSLLKFRGKPGIIRGKNAVQITSKVESEV